MNIRAYVSYSERRNAHYYRDFEVVEELPIIEKIEDLLTTKNYSENSNDERCISITEISLDRENSDKVYDYDYYEVEYFDVTSYNLDKKLGYIEDIEEYKSINYICVSWREKEEDFLNYIHDINEYEEEKNPLFTDITEELSVLGVKAYYVQDRILYTYKEKRFSTIEEVEEFINEEKEHEEE